MASSLLTTDRRWAAPARKSGMTVLGKVPKPINLPSQRLENNGLDPNLEIVPKGTLTWGSKPTQTPPNAWGSSPILSAKNDGSSSSPSHLNGRPSSGGGSRPSTAGSESLGSPNAWGLNSRPSSASGTFPSSNLPAATSRPQSAETRPGSSQLSRFADNASDNVKVSIRTVDRSGSTSHGHGFTLSTGDFPTLGSEKNSESSSQRGHSSKGRPTSSSGIETSQNEQGKNLAAGPGEVISPPSNQPGDILKTDQQHTHTEVASFPAASLPNEGQQPQPYAPNFHMPPQFDSWRAPPSHAPEGMWHRGAAPGGGPYRPVGPPGSFPGESFGYYGQFPPNSEAAARQGSGHGVYHPKNGDSYHPGPPNSYIMNQPVIPVRPVYQGPGPYDGYYGPRANFNNAKVRDPHFIGGPHQPGILNQFPNQNDKFRHGHSHGRQGKHETFPREQLESGRVQVFNREQPRILHDNPDRVGGTHEVEKNSQPAPPLLPHPDRNQTDLKMRTDIRDGFGDRNKLLTKSVPGQRDPAGIEHPSAFDDAHSLPKDTVDGTLRKKFKEDNSGKPDQQPIIKKNAALIEKIESLNNKTRNVDSRNVLEPASSKEFKRLQKGTDSKSNQVMKDVPPTAAAAVSASNQIDSVPHITSVLQRSPNVPTDCTVVGPLHSKLTEFSKAGKLGDSSNDRTHRIGDSSRNSLHGPAEARSANKFAGHGRGESSTTDYLPGIDMRNNNQYDQPPEGASQLQPVTDDMPASLDYESQRAKMRELAVQRAKKLQAEEEERIKNQKAKALAKLEELNRRSAVLQKKSNDMAVETDDGHNKQMAGLDVTPKLATSTAELHDVAVPDSHTAPQPPNDQHSMVLEQPRSTTLSHGASAGKDPVAISSSAGNMQSNVERVVQKSITQSHDANVPKPKQGFRKKHVASEEKNHGEKSSVPVSTGNAKKNVENSSDAKTAVTTSHDDAPALNKKGARHLRNKKKVEDALVTQHPPVVFNEQNISKVSSEPKTYSGGVIISSSIVPTEGTIVTVGSITVGGMSLPSLKQDCIKPSEGAANTENNRSKPQQGRRSGKHQHAVHPVEKPGNEGVLWAPVKQPEQNEQSGRAMPHTAVSEPTQQTGKSSNDGENATRIKRAEMERYVPKPLSKELQQQNLGPNLQLEKTSVDNKSHDKETDDKSNDANVDPATEPKKWEDKKSSKGHGKSHPSWRRRNTHESALVAPNADQAENSHGSKYVQKSAHQNQPIETDRQEIKQLKSDAATGAENSSVTAETVPLPVSGPKEHGAVSRQRRQHIKAQRNESKGREGRDDIIYQSATPAIDSNSASHRNIPRSDAKNSGAVSHSRAHWKPKSNSRPQGNNAVEGQVDSHGDTYAMNSSKGSDSTIHQDSSDKSIKRTDGTDENDGPIKQGNLAEEDGKQNETHTSAEQQQANPPVRHQGHHNGKYNRGGTQRGWGYESGRQSHGTNADRRRGGSHLEYQPVGSYKPRDFQQNPSVDERTEGLASRPVFRERGRSRAPRPAGHFVKRNPASTSTTNTYQEE